MAWPAIIKVPDPRRRPPNLVDYNEARLTFSWDQARSALDGLPGARGLNIAHEAVDRHTLGLLRDRIALRFLRREGAARAYSFAELRAETNRFANVLRSLGVHKHERVFTLLGRIPEQYVTALGTLKAGCVFAPLFAAFGPDPIRQRLELGDARVLVTTESLYRRRVAALRDALPGLTHVLLVGTDPKAPLPSSCVSFDALVSAASPEFEIPATSADDMALLHFTSGTTGMPKGAIHVHDAIVAHYVTGSLALDLQDDDIFWCTADPGWVTGTSYGIISPLAHGVTTIVDEADFDATRWYEILERERVTVWYTAPTALRMLMKAGAELVGKYDLSHLRYIASVGEPLNPQVVLWTKDTFGIPAHDNWWQTETGGIMIANFPSMDIHPGSMGKPLPGVDAAIAARDASGELLGADGDLELVRAADIEGELVLRPGWPSMFRGYLHDEARYQRCFVGGWYRTGDLVKRDEEGYFYFVGRGDDVIKSAGHLIGPFEVENAFMEHPAVVEAGVIGKPDPVLGEVVKVFVTLRAGYVESDDLRLELLGWGRRRLGAAVAPREVAFEAHLPHTSSGKIMRRLLKARDLGLPVGDTSTLEPQR